MQSQKKLPRTFSFEFFPPNTSEGLDKLAQTAKQLAPLNPKFFSVTYGAGGSTRERTLRAVLDLRAAGYAAAAAVDDPPDGGAREGGNATKETSGAGCAGREYQTHTHNPWHRARANRAYQKIQNAKIRYATKNT